MIPDIGPISSSGMFLETKNGEVIISGQTKTSNPGKLMQPFFDDVQDLILKNNINEIKVNIKDLSYLNSSGIKEFANWILKLDALPESRKYTITFVYDPEVKWQETFVSTISCLNQEFIKKSEN